MREFKNAAVTGLLAFFTSTEKTRKSIAVEARNHYSLSYRYYGKVKLMTEATEVESGQGTVTFMPKDVSYETEVTEDTKMAVIHFKLEHDIDFRNPAVIAVGDKTIRLLFEKLIQRFRPDESVDFGCMAIFYELLARLEESAPERNGERIPQKIRLAREIMRESFSDPFFSISTLTERLGISAAYLRREFAKAYGKSPVAFLSGLRIENAKNLLQSEYSSIGEIARLCGFSSSSYFIQTFNKAVGTSPDKYRKKL